MDVTEQAKERDWIRVVVAVVFVVAVIGLFSFLFRDHSKTGTTTATGFNLVAKDSFNRESGPIAYGKDVAAWKTISGSWSIAAGAAYVSEPAPLVNIAVIEAGANASVKAVVSGLGYCGLVANLVDEGEYLSLVRVEKYGVWNLERRRNGVPEVLAAVGGTSGTAATASILVDPPIVTASVGEKHVSVSVADLRSGRSAGLFAADPDPSNCAFDDVVISVPK